VTYSVYQHWDPLKICIVGRSYTPEFYSFIENNRVRSVMEQIAQETEEDYQKLISKLKEFDVKILRPNVSNDFEFYMPGQWNKILPPPMTPRDYSIMLGEHFFWHARSVLYSLQQGWNNWRGSDWPEHAPTNEKEIEALPNFIKDEIKNIFYINLSHDIHGMYELDLCMLDEINRYTWGDVLNHIQKNNKIYNRVPSNFSNFSAASSTRIGRDIYLGTESYGQNRTDHLELCKQMYPQYRWHVINTGGHSDATYCPVCPGLIVSLSDVPNYKDTFPDWEVVYLPGQSWSKVKSFLELKQKNDGKWWVPGQELNDDFTDFVETWLGHWVGYVEETVFDVNMLVIDQKNVICNNYNKQVFDALERHGVTPHIINFRHRYFWDGGLHCITSDVHREGVMQDYFPERG
jgi:hypothetical protein